MPISVSPLPQQPVCASSENRTQNIERYPIREGIGNPNFQELFYEVDCLDSGLLKKPNAVPAEVPPTLTSTASRLDTPCPVFSPGDFSDPRPPEVVTTPEPGSHSSILGPDSDPSSALLLEMFMTELDGIMAEREGGAPSPPSPVPSPLPLTKPSTSLECTPPPGLDIDDPFLMQFTDLDSLLQDTAVFAPCVSELGLGSPLNDQTLNGHNLMDLSDCVNSSSSASVSVCVSPFSNSTDNDDVVFDFSEGTTEPSPMLSQEVAIKHDHSYATNPEDDQPEVVSASRKRSASSSNSQPAKKPKEIVKDDRYRTRRDKNNVASQVSRAKRRSRNASMFDRVKELEVENARLRTQVEDMTAEAEKLRKLLVHRLAQ